MRVFNTCENTVFVIFTLLQTRLFNQSLHIAVRLAGLADALFEKLSAVDENLRQIIGEEGREFNCSLIFS